MAATGQQKGIWNSFEHDSDSNNYFINSHMESIINKAILAAASYSVWDFGSFDRPKKNFKRVAKNRLKEKNRRKANKRS